MPNVGFILKIKTNYFPKNSRLTTVTRITSISHVLIRYLGFFASIGGKREAVQREERNVQKSPGPESN